MSTRYAFQLTGLTPLLMHANDVMWRDQMEAWQKDPANKGLSKPGDDRTPPWTYVGYFYHDGTQVCLPFEHMSAAFRKAGTDIKIKGNKSFKQETQSGILFEQDRLEFLVFNENDDLVPVPFEPFSDTVGDQDMSFVQHIELARSLGLDLSIKNVSVQTNKHIRVRPVFPRWVVRGTLRVVSPLITKPVVQQLFDLAGAGGLGDWRPTSPRCPGAYGMFESAIKKVGK